MDKKLSRILEFMIVLIFTCIFFAELPWDRITAGPLIFQAYAKPKPVPEFSLENLKGKRVNIRDYEGQVLLLSFHATW
jgi:cytochrome oxidase Cu insertion factor (SCO1/SenC/PrrC family)